MADRRLDPSVETAPPHGWARWVRRLARQPERLAGFGGALAAGFLLSVVLIYAFAWLASEVLEQETTAMDQTAAHFADQVRSPPLDVLAYLVSLMGSEVVLIAGSLLVAIFLVQRRWGAATMLVLVAIGAQLLNDLLKEAFHRTRPEPVAGWIAAQQYAFPSGHAMVSAAFYGYLAYLAWRLLTGVPRMAAIAGLTLLVLAIGLARIYLEVHFLSDVIAGYLSGLLWTDAVILGSRLLVTTRHPGRRQQARTVRA